jgi:WD40 repeat protein
MASALQPFTQTMAGQDDLREFAWRYLWQQQSVRELFRAKLPARQYSACFAPDGKSVAFAGADSIVRRYSVDGFRLLQELPTAQKEINSVIYGPAGDWLATAGDDGTVAVWNLPSGVRRAVWPVFSNERAYQVAYSESKNLLIVCGNDPEVHLLDFATGEQQGLLTGSHSRGVESLSLSADGRRVLTCGADHTAVIWDLETRTALHRLDGFDYFVSSGAWSPDGRLVAVGALDNRLRVIEVESGVVRAERRLLDPVQSVAISEDGLILVGDRAGAVKVFRFDLAQSDSPQELAPVARWALHKHRIYGLFPSRGLFATASRDQEVAVFEPQIREPVIRSEPLFPGGWYTTRKMVGPDQAGRTYRIARHGIEVLISKASIPSATLFPECDFHNLNWKYDTLLATDSSGQLYQWNTTEELGEAVIVDVFPGDAVSRIMPLDPQRVLLQRVFRQHGLTGAGIWNLQTQHLDHFWQHQHNVMVSNNGQQFVLADNSDHQLNLFDASTLQQISSAIGHTESIKSIAFSRSGMRIYTASTDRTVRVWDAVTMNELLQLRGHEKTVISLAVSPDERTLASCDESGSLRLWDLRTGRELYELYRHVHILTWLEFSPDGEELLGIDNELAEFRWSCRGKKN